MLTFFTFPLHLHVGKHFIISTFLHLQFFLQPFWHPNFLNTVLFTMLWKQLNSLAMHPKISFNRNMKESAKKQCFAPFQSYICSNSIHRYATSVKYNSWHDGDSHITINFQEIRHVCNQNYDHLHHLFARKYLLDRWDHRNIREELSLCQVLNVKNQAYSYLPTSPLHFFVFFCYNRDFLFVICLF